MTEQLFSSDWYRVADLHPQLRRHVHVHRQVQRGRTWYVLADDVTGRQHRLDARGYLFVGQLDGRRSVDEIWLGLVEHSRQTAPTQDEVVQLIGQLHQAELIQAELAPDVEELFHRQEQRERQQLWGFLNPLAFRVPLWDPARVLNALQPVTGWLIRPAALWIWALLLLVALVGAGPHWRDLAEYGATRLPTSRYWLLVWLTYPLLKFLHETAHALVLRHFGGSVHEMGVSLLLMMPVPYVNASSATLLADKYQRIAVSAAGIMVEVFFASLAVLLWLNVGDGLLRETAFVVFSVAGVSTVVFNGNPLLKYDGYHILADWLEIPNLAARSRRYWAGLGRRHLLRVPDRDTPAHAPSEAPWLLGYGIAAYFYRWFVMILVAGWIGTYSVTLAVIIALTFLWGLLLKPGIDIALYLRDAEALERHRLRAWLATLGVLLAAGVLLGAIPLPYATLAQGVVWPPDEARLRPGASGFITEILVPDGDHVRRGEPLLVLRNDALIGRRQGIEARLASLTAQLHAVMDRDPGEARRLSEEIDSVRAELRRNAEEVDQLIVRSPADGLLVLPKAEDRIGSFVAKGETLGHVLGGKEIRVRAVVEQADAALVRERTLSVAVRLADRPDQALHGVLAYSIPSGTSTLPSAALGFSAGGPILTDPTDAKGLKTLEPVFVIDVRVPGQAVERAGGRAWLRFDHGRAPLLAQWALRWEQLFLQHFGAET